MSQLILARGTNYRRSIVNRLFPNVEIGPVFLIVSLIIFVALITVITLIFSARQVTKGYVLNSLESNHQNLLRESELKDMEISKVKSLQFIEDSNKAKSMREAYNVLYVSGDTVIAKL